jgi:chromate transport protein ChrA
VRRIAAVLVLLLTTTAAQADNSGPTNAEILQLAVAAFILLVLPPLLLLSLVVFAIWRHFRPRKKSKRPANDPNWTLSTLPPYPPPTRTAPPPGN